MDLNLLFYGVASIFYWIVGVKIVASFKKRGDMAPMWALPVIAAGLVAHFWVLQGAIFVAPETVSIGFGTIASAMCFFSTLILFFGAIYSRVHALFAIVLVLAGVGVWCPLIFPVETAPIVGATAAFKLHVAFGIVAYSFMMMAIVQAVLMTILDARFKSHAMLDEPEGLVATMPNLMMMEKILFRVVLACFIFLTLTIAGGFFAAGSALSLDHKTTLTIISWVLFGVLLLGRKFLGWRSKRAMRLFWVAVAFQVIAYFAYRLVLDWMV